MTHRRPSGQAMRRQVAVSDITQSLASWSRRSTAPCTTCDGRRRAGIGVLARLSRSRVGCFCDRGTGRYVRCRPVLRHATGGVRDHRNSRRVGTTWLCARQKSSFTAFSIRLSTKW